MALLVFNIERWVEFYVWLITGTPERTEVGYVYNLLLNSGISLVILGVPAALIGAVLPLMIRATVARGRIPWVSRCGRVADMEHTWGSRGGVVYRVCPYATGWST